MVALKFLLTLLFLGGMSHAVVNHGYLTQLKSIN